MSTKPLTNKELEKTTGGDSDNVFESITELYGHSIGDSHTIQYQSGLNSLTITIIGLDPDKSAPFHVELKYKIGGTGDCWYTRTELEEKFNTTVMFG